MLQLVTDVFVLHRRPLLADMEATDPTMKNDGPEVSDANWTDELRVPRTSDCI